MKTKWNPQVNKQTLLVVASVSVICVGLFAGKLGLLDPDKSYHPPVSNEEWHLKKSAPQIIKDYAKAVYGENCRVEIQGGFYGGTSQVIIYQPITSGIYAGGVQTYSFIVSVNENTGTVDSWKLYDHN